MAGKVKKYLLISTLVVVTLLTAIGFGLVPVNLFLAKPAISKLIFDKLGMDLEIHGPLRIRFGPTPALTASGITLSFLARNDEPLIHIEQVAIKPRLQAFLDGDVLLRDIHIKGADIDYCQGIPTALQKNSASTSERGSPPSTAIDKLRIRNIRTICSNMEKELGFIPQQLDLEASAPLNGRLEAVLEGRNKEGEFQLAISGGNLGELLKDPEHFPFELHLQLLDSEVSASGSVSTPLSDPEITVKGELVSELMANVTGNHHMSFDALVRGFSSRPYFELDAKLQQLDLLRLHAGTEGTGKNEESINFRPAYELLARFDAGLKISIEELLNAPLKVQKLVLEAGLEEGVLNLSNAEWLLAGSPVTAQALLDTREDCVRLTGGLQISDFEIVQLNRFFDEGASLGGQLGKTELGSSSCGDTLQDHLSSAQMTIAATDIEGPWQREELPMFLHRLQADISWQKAGSLSFDGELLNESLSVSASFGSIESILSGSRWPLHIDQRGEYSHLTMTGEAGILKDRLELDVEVNFETPRFGSLHTWIGSDPDNILAFQGRSALALGEDGLSLDNLQVTLGSSDIRGNMSWAGPDSDLPMVIELRSNKLELNEISSLFPDRAEAAQNGDLQWAELVTQSEWLEDWLELPPVNIDLAVKHLRVTRHEIEDATLRVSLRDRQIKKGRLGFRNENVTIEGAIDANLQERPWTVAYESDFSNIDIGGLMAAFDLADNVDAQAQRASMQLVSEGQTLQQLELNYRVEFEIEGLRWAFQAGAQGQHHEINFSNLQLTTAPASGSTWLASGYFNDLPLKVWMKSPSLQSTFNPARELPLTLVIDAGEDITMFDALIGQQSAGGRNVSLSVSGEFTTVEELDYSSLESPLKDYHLRSEVLIEEDQVHFSDLKAQVGTSSAVGDISIRYREPNYIFDIDIKSPFLETDDLVQWAENWRNKPLIPSEEGPAGPAVKAPEGGVLTLVNQSIDDFTNSNEFIINIGIDELRSSGQLLGEARLVLNMDDDHIQLDPLQITSQDARAVARYHSRNMDAAYEYSLDMLIEGLEYGGLLHLYDPDSRASGELFLDTSLSSRSPEVEQAVNHLQGTIHLAMFPEDFEAGFLDLWASNLIFALLPAEKESGKKMNCMVARFDVENGVMHSKNTFLDSTEVIVRARGDIDLVNGELDLLIAPQSKREKFLSISTPIAVSGPLSDFSVGFAPGGFLTTMFRWYYSLVYVPWKWLTGERFPADGIATCHKAMNWELPENRE